MKKLSMLLLSLFLLIAMAACNNSDDEATSDDSSSKDEETVALEDMEPTEPTEESTCVGCDMKVYLKDEEMGQFTAQALTEDGEYLFFDDVGCLLNVPRKTGETYVKTWVRDYNTLDWIETEDALAVHSDIVTPMKYGYAFFSSQDGVDQFMDDHADLNPSVVTWDDIDAEAYERFQQKMEMQDQQNNDDAGTSENSGH